MLAKGHGPPPPKAPFAAKAAPALQPQGDAAVIRQIEACAGRVQRGERSKTQRAVRAGTALTPTPRQGCRNAHALPHTPEGYILVTAVTVTNLPFVSVVFPRTMLSPVDSMMAEESW